MSDRMMSKDELMQPLIKPPSKQFYDALYNFFAEAMEYETFLQNATASLRQHGFKKDESIVLCSVCPDKLNQPFTEKIDELWKDRKDIGALAGMVLNGKMGLAQAARYAKKDARPKYVFFIASHIAISDTGEVGHCVIEGTKEPVHACLPLKQFQEEIASGKLEVKSDPLDYEQTLLKQHLLPRLNYQEIPSLVELTFRTYELAVDMVNDVAAEVVDPLQADYAVCSGVIIHGPNGSHYVWPGCFQALINEQEFSLNEDLRKVDASEIRKEVCANLNEKLIVAADTRQLDDVKLFVEKGADVDCLDSDMRTPLHLAAGDGSVDIATYLIIHMADVHARDRWGFNVIEVAVINQRYQMSKLLRRHGASTSEKFTAARLIAAAAEGQLELVKLYVEASISPKAAMACHDYDFRTALHLAATNGHLEVVKYLVKQGANIDKEDRSRGTAMTEAAKNGHGPVIDFLRQVQTNNREKLVQAEKRASDRAKILAQTDDAVDDF